MIRFICRHSPHLRYSIRGFPTQRLEYFQPNSHLSSSSSKRALKDAKSENAEESSYTVNYFIKQCGFSPERAISVSKFRNFDNNPEKPDVLRAFLKEQGFSEAQVLGLIRLYPQIVWCDPVKTLLPKIEFFLSRGFSKQDLPAIIARAPYFVKSSLEKHIRPFYDWLEEYIGSSKKTMLTLEKGPRLLCSKHTVVSNMEALREAGVPEARIKSFLMHWPDSLSYLPDKFKEAVEDVRELGIDPMKSSFVIAVHVLLLLCSCRSSWNKKMEFYKKCGCSEDEVLTAFVRYPWCMLVSEDKIEGIMKFFMSEMGWNPSRLLQSPVILSLSLNRRIIPRCSVYRVLISTDSIKKLPAVNTLLCITEERFHKRWLECYEKEAPGILKLYEEKMKLQR